MNLLLFVLALLVAWGEAETPCHGGTLLRYHAESRTSGNCAPEEVIDTQEMCGKLGNWKDGASDRSLYDRYMDYVHKSGAAAPPGCFTFQYTSPPCTFGSHCRDQLLPSTERAFNSDLNDTTACAAATPCVCKVAKCDYCPVGHVPDPTRTKCEPCPPGKYAAGRGWSECRNCAESTWSSSGSNRCCPTGQVVTAPRTEENLIGKNSFNPPLQNCPYPIKNLDACIYASDAMAQPGPSLYSSRGSVRDGIGPAGCTVQTRAYGASFEEPNPRWTTVRLYFASGHQNDRKCGFCVRDTHNTNHPNPRYRYDQYCYSCLCVSTCAACPGGAAPDAETGQCVECAAGKYSAQNASSGFPIATESCTATEISSGNVTTGITTASYEGTGCHPNCNGQKWTPGSKKCSLYSKGNDGSSSSSPYHKVPHYDDGLSGKCEPEPGYVCTYVAGGTDETTSTCEDCPAGKFAGAGESGCTTCTNLSTCPLGEAEAGTEKCGQPGHQTRNLVCRSKCEKGRTFSADGKSPCNMCRLCGTVLGKVKACEVDADAVCQAATPCTNETWSESGYNSLFSECTPCTVCQEHVEYEVLDATGKSMCTATSDRKCAKYTGPEPCTEGVMWSATGMGTIGTLGCKACTVCRKARGVNEVHEKEVQKCTATSDRTCQEEQKCRRYSTWSANGYEPCNVCPTCPCATKLTECYPSQPPTCRSNITSTTTLKIPVEGGSSVVKKSKMVQAILVKGFDSSIEEFYAAKTEFLAAEDAGRRRELHSSEHPRLGKHRRLAPTDVKVTFATSIGHTGWNEERDANEAAKKLVAAVEDNSFAAAVQKAAADAVASSPVGSLDAAETVALNALAATTPAVVFAAPEDKPQIKMIENLPVLTPCVEGETWSWSTFAPCQPCMDCLDAYNAVGVKTACTTGANTQCLFCEPQPHPHPHYGKDLWSPGPGTPCTPCSECGAGQERKARCRSGASGHDTLCQAAEIPSMSRGSGSGSGGGGGGGIPSMSPVGGIIIGLGAVGAVLLWLYLRKYKRRPSQAVPPTGSQKQAVELASLPPPPPLPSTANPLANTTGRSGDRRASGNFAAQRVADEAAKKETALVNVTLEAKESEAAFG